MKSLINTLEKEKLKINNLCYTNYEIKNNSVLIKKSLGMIPSTIETKEMVGIYNLFKDEKNIEFKVLENGDISIEKLSVNNQ